MEECAEHMSTAWVAERFARGLLVPRRGGEHRATGLARWEAGAFVRGKIW